MFLRRFVVALVVVVVVSGAGLVAASVLEDQTFSSIHRIKLPDNTLSPSEAGKPANYLIIGSDTRSFVDSEGQAQAFGEKDNTARSDVMMVVHVVPSLGTAYVVSFPRDTYVDIPGHGHQLLNAAFEIGGAALTIQTFQDVFGIPIQHYLAVNFEGFENIVNSIGHVKIFFPTAARDFFSQLDQPVAGCHSLDGGEALAYARSRHYMIPREGVTDPRRDEKADWMEDPRSDLDRIQRQQYFLRSLGQTALDHGASNPITAFHLAKAVTRSLTADETLSNRELKALVHSFVGLDPATVEMTTLPVTGGTNGDPLVAQYPEAQPIIDRLKNLADPLALPPVVDPATVKVVTVDGSGVDGRAEAVDSAFTAHGFKSGGFGDATSNDYAHTQVRYAPGQAKKGFTAALYLGTLNVVEASNTSVQLGSKELHGDVIVVVGRDYPKLKGPLTKPVSETTTTSAPDSTTTTTTTPAVTVDTRYVPVSENGLEPLVGCP
jgi:LCP family protein required for cell wall assembly